MMTEKQLHDLSSMARAVWLAVAFFFISLSLFGMITSAATSARTIDAGQHEVAHFVVQFAVACDRDQVLADVSQWLTTNQPVDVNKERCYIVPAGRLVAAIKEVTDGPFVTPDATAVEFYIVRIGDELHTVAFVGVNTNLPAGYRKSS